MRSSARRTSGAKPASSRWTASCRAWATRAACLSQWPWRNITARLCLWWLTLSLGCGTGVASTLTLVWERSAGAQGYRVWQATASGPFLVASTVTSTTATAQATEASRFFVTAFNGGGESAPSNVVSYTPGQTPPPTVPLAPTGLSGQFVGPKRIDVAWTSDATASIEVERSVNGGAWTRVSTVAPGTLHWSDLNVWKKDRHAYRVRSVNAAGASPYSSTITLPPQ